MSEDFKNHLASVNIGESNENNETEMVTDLFTGESIPKDADLSEEASGELVFEEEQKKEETKTEEKPAIKANDKGSFHGIFLSPINHFERIKSALLAMAETDEELAKAIAEGKKTFEGCDRFIKNNMKDLMREMHSQEVTFDDASVHAIARWYMVNPDAVDASPKEIVKATKETKKKETKKTEKKAEPKKETKKTKVVPLTPQMGSLFGDDDF